MINLDLDALCHNVKQIRILTPSSKILAVVKDNAYGHGLKKITQAIVDKVDGFGVISLDEAIAVRQYTLSKPTVLLQGIFKKDQLEYCLQHNLTILIHNFDQIKILSSYKEKNKKIKIWLKINCGLNRLGFRNKELAEVLKEIKNLSNIDYENICLMSHLSSVTTLKEETEKEISIFSKITEGLSFSKSLVSSAGIIRCPNAHFEWVRPGLLLYGVSPFSDCNGADLNLKPVMQFEANVISLFQCSAGETVGYNKTWKCSRSTRIAIINVGYADGYPFHIDKSTSVLVDGEEASIVGRVSSDAIAIDVTNIKKIKMGDKVLLWGNQLPVEKIALQAKTVPDQLLCGVSQRCIS